MQSVNQCRYCNIFFSDELPSLEVFVGEQLETLGRPYFLCTLFAFRIFIRKRSKQNKNKKRIWECVVVVVLQNIDADNTVQ